MGCVEEETFIFELLLYQELVLTDSLPIPQSSIFPNGTEKPAPIILGTGFLFFPSSFI